MFLKDKIKIARKEKKMTQEELAIELTKNGKRYTNTAISNWENGLYEPDIDTLALICKILKKDANYFLDIQVGNENKINIDDLDDKDIQNINEYIKMYKLAKNAKKNDK